MPLIKKRQLENWSQLSGDERERFIENLPAEREKIEDLFDYLDVNLEKSPCSHDLKNTMQFLMERRLNMPRFMSWLNENGAYCDCEILENVERQWFTAFAEEENLATEDTEHSEEI
jgi:DNA-binding MarR family transcriptional regulator